MLYASYDARSDVLYFSTDDTRPAYVGDGDDRVWFRRVEDDETPVGVTVFQPSRMCDPARADLIRQIADFLAMDRSAIEQRWTHLLAGNIPHR